MTAAGSTVWVLIISNRFGEDVTVHATEEGADGSLVAYVREWWDEDGPGARGGKPMPEDPIAAVEAYFEGSDEWHSLTERAVHDVRPAPDSLSDR